ncbi:hypothetical protein [Streptomyces rochei]|uniref:hypothetical protein n=1 Tax=Streptomyces rochei TaxID=1928 RepID=UPI003530F0A0
MKSYTKAAAAAIMATAATISFATSASATSYENWLYNSQSNKASKARWIENGDTVRVCDVKSDGKAAKATLTRASDGAELIVVNATNGYGTCNEVSKNIPENITLRLSPTIYANGTEYFYPDTDMTYVRWF